MFMFRSLTTERRSAELTLLTRLGARLGARLQASDTELALLPSTARCRALLI